MINIDYYINTPDIRQDIDIRSEVTETIYGTATQKPNSSWAVHRKIKRDSDGNPIKSANVDYITREPDLLSLPDYITPEGFLFDEELIRVSYSLSRILFQDQDATLVGVEDVKKVQFIFAYEDRPRRFDQLLTVEVDDDGKPLSPAQTVDRYNISNIYGMSNDYGRVEYWIALGERLTV